AARSDGDEAVLRLQLRRLLGALAELRGAVEPSAEDLPRELVQAQPGREVPVARLRREPPRAALDHRALRGPRRRRRDADRLPAPPRGSRHLGPRRLTANARAASRGRARAVAQRDEGSRHVLRAVRGPLAAAAARGAPSSSRRARLTHGYGVRPANGSGSVA